MQIRVMHQPLNPEWLYLMQIHARETRNSCQAATDRLQIIINQWLLLIKCKWEFANTYSSQRINQVPQTNITSESNDTTTAEMQGISSASWKATRTTVKTWRSFNSSMKPTLNSAIVKLTPLSKQASQQTVKLSHNTHLNWQGSNKCSLNS